ncbi:MAG TPA: FG-GAP-like repeat-containing protein [Verrucomicrobiae bacterium]|nr:FG-GAP-like repeat-containing protein [Verrucomicrobiae bacterium]
MFEKIFCSRLVILAAGLVLGGGLAPAKAQTAPSITLQPVSQAANAGSNVTYRASASGSAPLSYQWLVNQQPVSGATNTTLSLTNLQAGEAGGYAMLASNASGLATSQVARLDIVSGFTPVTTNILGRALQATGAAWGDFNNDGWVDLFVCSAAGKYFIYTNHGDGTFQIVTNRILAGDVTSGSAGAAWGDLDNDGWLDLAVGSFPGSFYVYHNLGNGQFERLPAPQFAVPSNLITFSTAWGDYDNDGLIDLFVPTATSSFAGANDLLYHNNGDGTFTKITNSILAKDNVAGQSAIWGDYLNNGRLDLFATEVSGGRNLLYQNNGNGMFTKITNAVSSEGGISGGAVWADFDNDGYLDLYVGNFGANSYLYHNNGDGTFTKIINSAAVKDGQSGGCVAVDFDNDGWIDIVMPADKNYLYHNNGDGTFTKVVTGALVTQSFPNWGGNNSFAAADVNRDGFPDLLLVDYGGNSQLYMNDGNSNNWLTVTCAGRVSNRAAIGAKVRVKATIAGKTFWQMRQISGGGMVYAQSEMTAAFGLGDAATAEVVRVEWPSGIVQEFTNVAAKQFLTIKEPAQLSAAMPSANELHLTIAGGKGLPYALEVSTNLADWNSLVTLTNQTGRVVWTNQIPADDAMRYFRAREL